MASQASTQFAESKKDILMLWHIHSEVAGSGKGRRHRVDVLNRAVIVFIAACWESYVEDVARETFDSLLENSTSPDAFPPRVRTMAARRLRDSKDERRIWELAGSGWKTVLVSYRDEILEKWLKDFNTPKSGQVNELFSGLLNSADITASWGSPDMSAEEARTKLDEYMVIRGNIAHRTEHKQTVYKNAGKDFMSHISRLVDKTDEALGTHLQALTNITVW